jgi:hypothetical protein
VSVSVQVQVCLECVAAKKCISRSPDCHDGYKDQRKISLPLDVDTGLDHSAIDSRLPSSLQRAFLFGCDSGSSLKSAKVPADSVIISQI